MENLGNMLNNQQQQNVSVSDRKTWLRKMSYAYMCIGCIVFALGIILFITGVSNSKEDAITVGVCMFFGGLFTVFVGCIGEAIDDIRNNTKK